MLWALSSISLQPDLTDGTSSPEQKFASRSSFLAMRSCTYCICSCNSALAISSHAILLTLTFYSRFNDLSWKQKKRWKSSYCVRVMGSDLIVSNAKYYAQRSLQAFITNVFQPLIVVSRRIGLYPKQ